MFKKLHLTPPPTLRFGLSSAPPPINLRTPPPDNYCTVPKGGYQRATERKFCIVSFIRPNYSFKLSERTLL